MVLAMVFLSAMVAKEVVNNLKLINVTQMR